MCGWLRGLGCRVCKASQENLEGDLVSLDFHGFSLFLSRYTHKDDFVSQRKEQLAWNRKFHVLSYQNAGRFPR